MSIGLVWAQAHDRVIGAGNSIPWRVPEDLRHFKQITGSARVVMGRRTWQSLPERFRPLPGRENVVVSRGGFTADGARVVASLAEAIADAGADVWIIGGGQVYADALPLADLLEVTELDLAVDGDTYAPALDGDWVLSARDPDSGWHTSATHDIRFRFLTYRRA